MPKSESGRGSQQSMNAVVVIAALAIGGVLFSTTTTKSGGGVTVALDPKLDTDGDGVIEPHELAPAAKPRSTRQEDPTGLDNLDLDGDGVVEDHELDEIFFARHRVTLLCASTSVMVLFAVVYMHMKAKREAAEAAERAAEAGAAEARAAEARAAEARAAEARGREEDSRALMNELGALRRTPTTASDQIRVAAAVARQQREEDSQALMNELGALRRTPTTASAQIRAVDEYAQAARLELQSELLMRTDPDMAEMGLTLPMGRTRAPTTVSSTSNRILRNKHIAGINAGIKAQVEAAKIADEEAQIVALAEARQLAEETAQLHAATNRESLEEEAQINTADGTLTVAEALAKMDAAGANGMQKGEFEFACKHKQWTKANKLYHTTMKTYEK